jgi:ABC-type nickel/cobalt efflux system permease component RcnA
MPVPDESLSFLLFGLLLGIQHTLEPDHVAAVSTIVSQARGIRRSSLLGSLWGLGHTASLFVVAFIILAFKLTISDEFGMVFELLVGVMLVALGVEVVRRVLRGKIRIHVHTREGGAVLGLLHSHTRTESHQHAHRSVLVGMMHGLAGSGALILLMLTAVDTIALGLLFVLSFGLGLMLGMALISALMALPLKLTRSYALFNGGIRLAAGLGSVGIGLTLIYQIAVLDHLLL